MTQKELEQYYTISARIDAIDQEIRELYAPQMATTGAPRVDAGKASVHTAGSAVERNALRVIALREQLEREREELYALAERIENWLDTIEDAEIEAIVRWHYLLRCNWRVTNLKVYGYPDYQYARSRLLRYFKKNEIV